MLSSFVMNIEGKVPGVKGYRAAEKEEDYDFLFAFNNRILLTEKFSVSYRFWYFVN